MARFARPRALALALSLPRRLDLTARLGPTLRGMLWMIASGMVFAVLNAIMRVLTEEISPFETQFLRYLCGFLVMFPLVARAGLAAYSPKGLGGQLWRGVVHTSGLLLWFIALPRISLSQMTALGFTTPIFVMIGAAVLLAEPLRRDRLLAAAIGFAGVLIVVWPHLSGSGGAYNLVMLASSPLFAASSLITKALTRRDRPEVIVVWQSMTISLFSLPFALIGWTWPSPGQAAVFLLCGLLGSTGHYCQTRALRAAEISATQPVKFLDLIWNSLTGFLVFADLPSHWTVLGGLVIFLSTTWIARREARGRRAG